MLIKILRVEQECKKELMLNHGTRMVLESGDGQVTGLRVVKEIYMEICIKLFTSRKKVTEIKWNK